MVEFSPDCSFVVLTLPHEDPLHQAHQWSKWLAAYPDCTPIEEGYRKHAFTALVEKQRIEQARAALRTQKVRTAVLDWERAQEDTVAYWLEQFSDHPPSALVGLLRSAAGCRWAIDYWTKLAQQLEDDGTWYGEFRVGAIQLQGQSACLDELFISETAYLTWLDCLGGQPNPKQRDIDLILDRRHIPKAIQDRDIVLWPRDRQACRARLQAIVDTELLRLKALEETLRVEYEEPAKAEARLMALASVTREEMKLLRAEQIHEQSYQRAATALLKARQQSAAAPAAAATRQRDESKLIGRSIEYLTLGVRKPEDRGESNSEAGAAGVIMANAQALTTSRPGLAAAGPPSSGISPDSGSSSVTASN